MPSANRTKVVYVTNSQFKSTENQVLIDNCVLSDGSLVRDLFDFDIRVVPITEVLEVDLALMVQAEVKEAYRQIRVPCVVEHAGLIFKNRLANQYPGGLTKPMWNA